MAMEFIVCGILVAAACGVGVYTLFHIEPNEMPLSSSPSERSKVEGSMESRLFKALIFNGYIAYTRVPCGGYQIDIVLPHYRLAIECEGEEFHSSRKQEVRDRKKERYLQKQGYSVMRISGHQMNGNMKEVLKRINNKVTKLSAP